MATEKYKLLDYLKEDSRTRSPFFAPENTAGPDLVFFVEFKDGRKIPVIVQVKLRNAIKVVAQAIATTDPRLFYTTTEGLPRLQGKKQKVTGERNSLVLLHFRESNIKYSEDEASERMASECHEGVIRILVVYPAVCGG